MSFEIRKSSRKKSFFKIGLTGVSGSGKTYSALKLAYGIVGDWKKITLIDTENCSGDLYSGLGEYNIIQFKPPHSPQRYMEVLEYAWNHHPGIIIIDSISHEWDGSGGCLQMVEGVQGVKNDFAKWGKVTPIHIMFVQSILNIPCHVISTTRRKTEYAIVQDERTKKAIPKKIGLKSIQREGIDYEWTLEFEIDQNHFAIASKDRTGIFASNPVPFQISEDTGKKISDWNNEGEGQPKEIKKDVIPTDPKKTEVINRCKELVKFADYNGFDLSPESDLFSVDRESIKKLIADGDYDKACDIIELLWATLEELIADKKKKDKKNELL